MPRLGDNSHALGHYLDCLPLQLFKIITSLFFLRAFLSLAPKEFRIQTVVKHDMKECEF